MVGSTFAKKVPKLTTLEDLMNLVPKEILKEPRENFEQRKISLEMEALKEEKERAERERRGKFNEKDFDFHGETDLVINKFPEGWDEGLEFKSGSDAIRAFMIKGWAAISPEMKIFYRINDEQRPIHLEHFTYVKIKKNKLMMPYLYKLSRKMKIREVRGELRGICEIDTKTLLTKGDIEKRAELLAKIFVRCNLANVLEEEQRRELAEEEERERKKREEEEEQEQERERRLKAISIQESDNPMNKKRDSIARRSEDFNKKENNVNQSALTEEEKEEVTRRRTIATRKATYMGDLNPIVEEEEERPKKRGNTAFNGGISDDYNSNDVVPQKERVGYQNQKNDWDHEKRETTVKVFNEIMDFLNKKIAESYQEGDMDKCIFYSEKKEEMESSMNDNRDPDGFLRTLLIFKINNYY